MLDLFPDSTSAMTAYAESHREAPARERYVFHTGRKTVNIAEIPWLGPRGA